MDGKSQKLHKMVAFALAGIISFSSNPLRVAMSLGVMCSMLACVGIFYAIFMRIFTSVWVEGWTALMIAVLFIGGIQLIALGVIGEYLARVYTESKSRPLYVVNDRLCVDASAEDDITPSAERPDLEVLSGRGRA